MKIKMGKIPNAEELLKSINPDCVEDCHKAMKEFAIEILKYNLKQYRTQLQQFNTGDVTKFKSFDEITLETIKELENDSNT